MSGVTVAPANQQVPAHYLNRKFANTFNLPKLGPLADPSKNFPSLGQNNALALAALALARLRTAQLGVAQANDGTIAGNVAAWGAELTAAQADADKALHAVTAAIPLFVPSATIFAKMQAWSTDAGKNKVHAPSQLPATWATAPNAVPTENNITTNVAHTVAINLNFKTLGGVADVDSDVTTMTHFNGVAVDPVNGVTVTIGGVDFHATAAGVVTAAAQPNAGPVFNGTYQFSDDEGGDAVQKTFAITIT